MRVLEPNLGVCKCMIAWSSYAFRENDYIRRKLRLKYEKINDSLCYRRVFTGCGKPRKNLVRCANQNMLEMGLAGEELKLLAAPSTFGKLNHFLPFTTPPPPPTKISFELLSFSLFLD